MKSLGDEIAVVLRVPVGDVEEDGDEVGVGGFCGGAARVPTE